jgi:hypothetical protein
MGPVETEMLTYIRRRHSEGALAVPASEVMGAVAAAHPEFRKKAAYQRGLERLHRRHVINAVDDASGATHYFIGDYPSAELRKSLGR